MCCIRFLGQLWAEEVSILYFRGWSRHILMFIAVSNSWLRVNDCYFISRAVFYQSFCRYWDYVEILSLSFLILRWWWYHPLSQRYFVFEEVLLLLKRLLCRTNSLLLFSCCFLSFFLFPPFVPFGWCQKMHAVIKLTQKWWNYSTFLFYCSFWHKEVISSDLASWTADCVLWAISFDAFGTEHYRVWLLNWNELESLPHGVI